MEPDMYQFDTHSQKGRLLLQNQPQKPRIHWHNDCYYYNDENKRMLK